MLSNTGTYGTAQVARPGSLPRSHTKQDAGQVQLMNHPAADPVQKVPHSLPISPYDSKHTVARWLGEFGACPWAEEQNKTWLVAYMGNKVSSLSSPNLKAHWGIQLLTCVLVEKKSSMLLIQNTYLYLWPKSYKKGYSLEKPSHSESIYRVG